MEADLGPKKPVMLMIAGFGDNASMFDGLVKSELAETFDVLPLDLPGFGGVAAAKETTLSSLADFVASKAIETGAEVIVAHSVASIIASFAEARWAAERRSRERDPASCSLRPPNARW